MRRRLTALARPTALSHTVWMLAVSATAGAAAEGIDYFERHVRPILAEHCYECHSTSTAKLKGGLALDSEAGWMDGGDSGEVIIPGEPAKSPLIRALSHEDPDLQMPPKYRLSNGDIDALQTWIKMGAPDPRDGSIPSQRSDSTINLDAGRQFWAFQKPVPAPPPAVADTAWARDPIDHYVLAGLEAKGLKPVADADRHTLIRRATFDLIGLPPTPEEIDAFANDTAPQAVAFAKVIDRLLASPHFGERWGRHWLDLARYAESMGRTRNWPFPFAWRYRDYVIAAFNRDTRYNRFLAEQLAGDLLPAVDDAQRDRQLIATGFLTLGSMDLNERDAKVFQADQIDEQIDVTSRAILGLTVACARCHDHKFDPIPTSDYYALAGIFGSTKVLSGLRNKGGGGNGYLDAASFAKLHSADPTPVADRGAGAARRDEDRRIERLQKRIAAIQQQLRQTSKNKKSKAQKNLRSELKQLTRQLDQGAKGGRGGGVTLSDDLVMAAGEAGKVGDWRINVKGDPKNLGAEIERGFPQVLLAPGSASLTLPHNSSGRLELARWITSPEHPLTSRVMVNRIWHHLFGQGIVRTVDNFGETGERPSDQALLDHLALRFSTDHAWSIKRTIREIMLSRTYALSSRYEHRNFEEDPDNRLHWRANVRRLEAEAIRDSLLAISGELDRSPADASPVRRMRAAEIGQGAPAGGGEESTKRSVYLPIIRNYVPPVLETFDFAEPSSVTGRRDITTVSTQALYLMNNPFVIAQAKAAAGRLESGSSADPSERVQDIYIRAFGRRASKEEADRAIAYVGEGQGDAWSTLYQAVFASSEFRYLQ